VKIYEVYDEDNWPLHTSYHTNRAKAVKVYGGLQDDGVCAAFIEHPSVEDLLKEKDEQKDQLQDVVSALAYAMLVEKSTTIPNDVRDHPLIQDAIERYGGGPG
jgi:hypothetical protein